MGKRVSLYPIYRLLHEMSFKARREGLRVRHLAYDEHRLGLKPVYRRVWSRKG
ncbi:hypothetical protein KQ693_04990 [Thermus sp. PS18]|uniref:Transposase n=1 Tax=Thermus brevis TaxID=2862456 RepID=A0ABS7A3L9_9DEIN|nr:MULTISPECIES: hypothetical protein [Thermus]MBW6395794.1 hypothetical protein [Thermus brevis]UZX16384.1 hypothetical protein KQ693_04990 [Thermus sp. PS18]